MQAESCGFQEISAKGEDCSLVPSDLPVQDAFARKNRAGEAVSDIRAVHVLAPSWKEVIESGDSSSATSMNVFLTLPSDSDLNPANSRQEGPTRMNTPKQGKRRSKEVQHLLEYRPVRLATLRMTCS